MHDIFKDFKGREKALRNIIRWAIKPVMFYRPNLLTHGKHVYWLIKDIAPHIKKVFPKFETERALMMALVHDDPEIIVGDVQAGSKLKMTKAQLKDLNEKEEQAIDKISKRFPKKVGEYIYKDLLIEAHNKKTLEAQIVNFVDKMDAFGEALHEVFAGNILFTQKSSSEYGNDIPTPVQFYIDFHRAHEKKVPLLTPLFATKESFFANPEERDFTAIANEGIVHSLESLKTQSRYFHYDLWKRIILKHADEEEIKNLITQKEFQR
jgi:5'-deoxynucleotidase YfbR-like HD superfamily hydrolase